MSMSLPRLPFGKRSFRLPSGGPSLRNRLNGTGTAGPRRILAFAGAVVALGAVVLSLTLRETTHPPVSRPGRLPQADPLPGGPNSNPYQDALAMRSNQEEAARQQAAGQSFTPQIAPSQPYADKPHRVRGLLTSPPPPPPPAAKAAQAPQAAPPASSLTTHDTAATAKVVQIASQQGQGQGQPQGQGQGQDDTRYKTAIDRLMGGWGSRPPRTDVILPPDQTDAAEDSRSRGGQRSAGQSSGEGAPATASPASASPGRSSRQRVLIPAGRGVQAHTILAASSDQNSSVVLEADSGPIIHSRLIGSFSREGDRLVIRVSKMTYAGHEEGVDGVIVSPETMEAGVASSVDHHYAARFLLPAAAAFVSGLGQAIGQSNSTVVASPFGGASAFQRLNLGQQAGVGAGAAAARVGQALDQAAPRNSTVNVDARSSVAVMFLSDVTVPD